MKNSVWIIVAVIAILVVVVIVAAMGNKNQSASGTTPTPTSAAQVQQTGTVNTDNTISISNFTFGPATLTVNKGTTVTWTNNDSVAHQIAADSAGPEGFGSVSLDQGETYSYVFDQTGTWNYHCSIHPEMTGTIVVTE